MLIMLGSMNHDHKHEQNNDHDQHDDPHYGYHHVHVMISLVCNVATERQQVGLMITHASIIIPACL